LRWGERERRSHKEKGKKSPEENTLLKSSKRLLLPLKPESVIEGRTEGLLRGYRFWEEERKYWCLLRQRKGRHYLTTPNADILKRKGDNEGQLLLSRTTEGGGREGPFG